MKLYKYLTYSVLLGAVLSSCTNEAIQYDGDPFLSFKTESSQQLVDQGSGSKIVTIDFGTIAKVANADVKLVADPTSELKEGVDFEILAPGNPSGNFEGKVSVKLLESGATPNGKNAVFRLSSPTIKNGTFNQVHTMKVALKCPISYFIGSGTFSATIGFFNNQTVNIQVTEGPEPNTLLLKNYYADGTDIKLSYNPSTGVINMNPQTTGYINTNGMVSMRIATTGPSTINFCTRTIVLRSQCFVTAGNYAAQVDNIVGK